MSIFIDTDTPLSTDTKKFMNYLKVSDISYFNQGAYGIGYKVNIRDVTKSEYNILSLNNTEESIKCGQLFVKLVPIFDSDSDVGHELINNVLDMYPTPSKDFLNEIKIQSDVYKKTNEKLEAVCPPIVYSNIVNNTEKASRALILLSLMIKQMPNDENKVFLERMKRLYEGNRQLKLGIIAMSFAKNYDTLRNVLRNTNNIGRKAMYKYLAVYELLRLYDIGYMHGDYHTQNILINTNYKYNNLDDNSFLGRALIIDYGLAFKNKHKTDDIPITPSVKLHIMAQEKHPQTSQNAYSWDSYKWLIDFIETEPGLNNNYQVIKNSITNFQDQMIVKINENYPGIITQIRDINESKYRGSVIKGGRALYETQPQPLVAPSKMTTKTTDIANQKDSLLFKVNKEATPVISTAEFQELFNPSNLNMTDIVINYENTVRDGVLILLTDDKTQTGKGKTIGGKTKKRTVRKTKKRTVRKIRKQSLYKRTKITRKRQSRKNKK